MNHPSLDGTQASSNPLSLEHDAFAMTIRQWIEGFHGDIAPFSEEQIDKRVNSYLRQEQLYLEKVGFLMNVLPEPPKNGLDIGSSAGGLSVALALRGINMEGIEPSAAGVKVSGMRAQRLGLGNVRFQQGVGEKLPFADNTFDLVISLAVLEHVQDVPTVVREAFRVLKPGRWAYFEVPNNLFPFEGHYKMAWLPMMPKPLAKMYVRLRGAYPGFLDHLHYMSRPIVTRHFRQAGFVRLRDLYADHLAGKASGAAWADKRGRLARMPWSAPFIRLLCGHAPTAWFTNRAVCLLAQKPEQRYAA
jgi:SAM-dependent methyltransferase